MTDHEQNTDRFDAKEFRLSNPSGWMTISRYETIRLIIDALLEAQPEHEFNKSELERRTGVSREAIRKHISTLIELGIVEQVDEKGWPEYKLKKNSKVVKELNELNSAINSVLSGETKTTQKFEIQLSNEQASPEAVFSRRGFDEFSRESVRQNMGQDNSQIERRENNLIESPQNSIQGDTNAV
jgi:DNA-binding transcriptional ArsR family regulator